MDGAWAMLTRGSRHSAGGEQGAARALAIYREEIDRTMVYLGCAAIGDLNRGHLFP